MFHRQDAMSVPAMRYFELSGSVTRAWFTMSFWMVAPTLSGKIRKATKLKTAAQMTAACGLSTRVETTVAIELAASCMPLRKSKVRASRISSQTSADSSQKWLVPACSKAWSKKWNI